MHLLKTGLRAALLVVVTIMVCPDARAGLVYVGAFNVGDGPFFGDDPVVYSARDAAALIFGGVYTDYAISTINSTDPSTVNFKAFVDGYNDPQYLTTAVSEDFKLGTTYLTSGGAGGAYSAFVSDHVTDPVYNYVWQITADPVGAPAPATLFPAILGAISAVRLIRRRKPERTGKLIRS
jgi:hypothetical protein